MKSTGGLKLRSRQNTEIGVADEIGLCTTGTNTGLIIIIMIIKKGLNLCTRKGSSIAIVG